MNRLVDRQKSLGRRRQLSSWAAIAAFILAVAGSQADESAVDLLKRYPTTLTAGDQNPDHARQPRFTADDVFRLSRFDFKVGDAFHVATGAADLGVGHCADGAVWAVVIPREGQERELNCSTPKFQEPVAHVWLRFHPGQINKLFPPETVAVGGAASLISQIEFIARHKMTSSWQAGGKAMIPDSKDLTVDVDTKDGSRRFFIVDTAAQTAEYVNAFEGLAVKPPPLATPQTKEAAFDRLWLAFDKDYAMFVLRPKVDWNKLRDQYRPKALAARTTYEFAQVCAEMLKPLRDLHVWMTLNGEPVPIFNRPRSSNANPSARAHILGPVQRQGSVEWAFPGDKIGYIAVSGWSDKNIPAQFDQALEKMRGTRGLIVDVRLNGGGGELLAREVAGRFLSAPFVYGYDQRRNGPAHTDLTEKDPRTVNPKGPWRYDRPVVLLIGQKCMSSNESFVGMMMGDPDLVTMGDHTCGSSGNPKIIHLPLDMTVSVPQWIDYLPDGTVLDEHGFQPQVPFKATSGAFTGDQDDLLEAALERLRK